MNDIKNQFIKIQDSLAECLLALGYWSDLVKNKHVLNRYKPLSFFCKISIEYFLLKVAVLTDTRDRFHIKKPFNKILTDKNFIKTINIEQREIIQKIAYELDKILHSSEMKEIKKIRDKYIAHNDLANRDSFFIKTSECESILFSLSRLINSACSVMGFPTFSLNVKENNPIESMLTVLENASDI